MVIELQLRLRVSSRLRVFMVELQNKYHEGTKTRRNLRSVLLLVAFSVTLVAFATKFQTVQPTSPTPAPSDGFTFLVLLGTGDAEERDWSGELTIADGQVLTLDGWKFFGSEWPMPGTKAIGWG